MPTATHSHANVSAPNARVSGTIASAAPTAIDLPINRIVDPDPAQHVDETQRQAGEPGKQPRQ